MAITKKYIYSEDVLTALSNLYDFFNENAVPEYFDKIVKDTDNLCISCFVGEHVFLKIYAQVYNYGIYVYTTNGIIQQFAITSSETGGNFWSYLYKCNRGICIARGKDNNTFTATITKDKNGNTAIVVISKLSRSTSSYNYLYSIGVDDDNVKYYTLYVTTAEMTALTNIPTCDCNGSYLPDVYLLSFTQNTACGVIDINGTKYLSNGLWCVKDE